jgi:glutathione S-transferase
MSIILYTYDWVPEFPRGFVRDLRVRWACEEIGRDYQIDKVPLHPKSQEHRTMQPFGQVPVIRDGDLVLFESGAILLHLAEDTPLLPKDRRAVVTQWLIAALNSVEAASGRWLQMTLAERLPEIFGPPSTAEAITFARGNMLRKLDAVESRMVERDWIAGGFSVADIMMVDVLRILESEGVLSNYPALAVYVARATARPAFQKALADHMAHWQAAEEARVIGETA